MKNEEELKKIEKLKPKKKTFNSQLQDIHDRIIDVVAETAEMRLKVIKLEALIKIMHVLIKRNCSDFYLKESSDFIFKLKNKNFKNDDGLSLNIYAGEPSQNARFSILVEWFSLILEEMPMFFIEGNLERVE